MIAQLQENKIYSPEEYLEFEENSEERHEYIAGEIRLRPGGTSHHNLINGNFCSILNLALKPQPYNVFLVGLRLWIPKKRVYAYPDAMIILPPIEYAENRDDTVTNPLLIGEVLSKSTRNYDRGDKFAAYRTIPSFQEYILIDQYSPHVEQYRKTEPNQWIFTEYDGLDAVLSLSSVSLQIELADLYDKVNFAEEM